MDTAYNAGGGNQITLSEADLIGSSLPTKADDYYVVLLPTAQEHVEEPILTEAAKVLQLKPVELSRIVALRQPLPATRTATIEEASEITDALRAFGIEGTTVPG